MFPAVSIRNRHPPALRAIVRLFQAVQVTFRVFHQLAGVHGIPHLALSARGLITRGEGEQHAEISTRIHFENRSQAIEVIADDIATISAMP